MKLAEYYYETEGDVAQVIDMQIDVGLRLLKSNVRTKD